MADRMFHVLVLGGFALAGCGGSSTTKVTPAAEGGGGAADGASGVEDANGEPASDALTDDATDALVSSDGPQPLQEAAAADGSTDAYTDASSDVQVDACSHAVCCTVNCCVPTICEGPQ
jgi:hypothetical protein